MAKVLLGTAMGLALGLLAGWFLFGGGEAPAREVVRTVYLPAEPEPGFDAPSPEETSPEGAGTAPVRLGVDDLRTASAEELGRLAAQGSLELDGAAVTVLIERLDAAREARDWNQFRALLSLLGRAGTPEAEAKLVAVMGDPGLGFQQSHLGPLFYEWLKDSQAPGIVAAARARLEREMEDHPGMPGVRRGWLSLIAAQGDTADLDWVETFADTPGGAREVQEALAAAGGRPEVAERVERMFRERKERWFIGHLRLFATANPAAGARLLEDGLQHPRPGEERDLARTYGDTLPRADVERARAFLSGLRTPSQRMAAVYAVERMRRRGLDMGGMEDLVLAPVLTLERYRDEPNLSPLVEARYAIEHNPITWSERTAKALESAAERVPPAQAGALLEAARRVRAGIASPDSEWVTK